MLMLACCMASAVGCASGSLLQTSKAVLKSPINLVRNVTAPKKVTKVLSLWEPAEGQGIDERPGRGFAGQIMFFTNGSASPVKVNSIVRIYEYKDFSKEDPDPTPIHTFNFAPGAMEAHRTEGTLGHTYNVFLPFVEKGNSPARCALRVEVEDADGNVVSSPFTEVALPGRNTVRPATSIERGVVGRHTRNTGDSADKQTTAQAATEQLDTLTIAMPKTRR